MEPEGLLPHSQVPATCPYPETARSSTYPTSHFLKIHLKIIFPSTPGYSKLSFSSGFPSKTLYVPFLSPIRGICRAHLILLGLITRIILGEDNISLSSSLRSLLHFPVTSSLLGQNIILSTLFSNTFILSSSLNVSDQVSHPYKTRGNIIILYILIFTFMDSKLEDKRLCTE